jgi:pimeloyl-ACP methyl ester carboxylesterase
VVVVSALTAGILYRSWVAAQARAFTVLAVALDVPVAGWATRVLTDEPRAADVMLGGVPALVVLPGGVGPWPPVVFVNGVTERGRRHPDVRRLADGLARAGFLVVVPDPPGLAAGELSPATLEGVVAAAKTMLADPNAHDEVALIGVSVGGSLALAAAADPRLADRVSVVAALAPYADLEQAFSLGTTGHYRDHGEWHPFEPEPLLALVVARSLAAALPSAAGRERLLAPLRALDEDAEQPLAAVPRPDGLPDDAAAAARLLHNRDPRRFDALFAGLRPDARAGLGRLSPLRVAGRIRARVELASAPRDKYFPLAESRALANAAPDARLTVTDALRHVDARLESIGGLLELDALAVRVLREAR